MLNKERFHRRVLELIAGALVEAGAGTDGPAPEVRGAAPGIWDVDSFSLLQLLVVLEDEFEVPILATVDEFDGDSVEQFVDFVAGRATGADPRVGTFAPPQVPVAREEVGRVSGQPGDVK